MSIFKQQLRKRQAQEDSDFEIMFRFGLQMADAMGLSCSDLSEAADVGMEWRINGFIIKPRCFPQNGWRMTLVAAPCDPSKIGYVNCKEEESLPKSWAYKPKGTAAVFYPPAEIREEIIDRVKEKERLSNEQNRTNTRSADS